MGEGERHRIDKTPAQVQQFLEKVVDLYWDLDSQVCLSSSCVSWLFLPHVPWH